MSAPGQPPMRVAIAGASGRMGRMLIEALQDEPGAVLSAALDRADSPSLGLDASAHTGRPSGIAITEGQGAGLAAALAASDVLIDFTRPEASMLHAQACAEAGVRLVIGTTGFSPQQRAELAAAATKVGMVQAPNMSVGVQVVMHLLRQAAQALSQGYDVEVIETHHRHKVDAPSGTALQMGEVLARALGRDLNECGVFARHGHTGERRANEIGFSTIRGGDVVGDHTVLFAGVGERIEISHKSSSRVTYAQGSFRAARFLMQSPPGLYTMADVLGLEPL